MFQDSDDFIDGCLEEPELSTWEISFWNSIPESQRREFMRELYHPPPYVIDFETGKQYCGDDARKLIEESLRD